MATRGKQLLLQVGICGVSLLLVPLFLTGLQAAQPQGAGADIEGPHEGPAAAPATVHLSWLPPFGEEPRPVKPFLHHRGPERMDRDKAAAGHLPPGPGIQTTVTTSPLTATSGTGFDGISSGESFCNCYPPDGAVAVSSSYILAAVNTAVKIWNKSGTALINARSLTTFLRTNTSCLPNVSDPFAGYDAVADRFVLGALTYNNRSNSTICIAASLTNDPTGAWWIYAFPVSPSRNLLDFPHVAIGSDAIYLAGNQFLYGMFFSGARVYAYNKTQMYGGQPTNYKYYNVGANAAGHTADSLYPVQAVGVPSTAYFLAADNCNGCSNISLWKWTNPFNGTGGTFTLRGGVTVTAYNQPPNAQQLGGSAITTNDARNLGGYWYNDASNGYTVYGTHAIGCNPGSGTVACVQWYQLSNLDGTPALVQQGIYSSNGQYRYYPNLAVDSGGNMILAYAYSSSADYAGIRYTGRQPGDPLNTLQGESVLKVGEAPASGGRWGDYAGTVLDPNGSTVWHFEEYAKSGSLWGTWVGSACFTSTACQ